MFYTEYNIISPITVATLFEEAFTVFARSSTGVVGPNSTGGIDICVRFPVLVFGVNSGLAMG
jgi:hypothetical protein